MWIFSWYFKITKLILWKNSRCSIPDEKDSTTFVYPSFMQILREVKYILIFFILCNNITFKGIYYLFFIIISNVCFLFLRLNWSTLSLKWLNQTWVIIFFYLFLVFLSLFFHLVNLYNDIYHTCQNEQSTCAYILQV